MNDNMYYPRKEDDEFTIDIVNLVGHILKKWKLILVVAIVCAVIGGIVGIFRSGGNHDAASADGGEDISVAVQVLTEAQKNEAEGYCEQLKAYDQAIRRQKKLNDESYFMNLDPSTAAGSNIWYMIETELGNITTIYSDMLNDDDYRKISEVLDTEKSRTFLEDAVTVWSEETTDSYDMDITRTDRMSGDIKNGYKLLLKLTVTAPDRNSCDKIAEIAEAAVQRETDNLARYGAMVKCTLINKRTFDTDVEERIVSTNLQMTNALGAIETSRGNFYNNIISKVAENEKAYIDELYYADSEASAGTLNESKILWKRLFKYVIVCIAVGVAAVICIIAVVYVLGGKLHVADEIYFMGIPVLQTLGADASISFSMLMEELKKKTETETKKIYIAADKSSARAMEYAKSIYDEAGGAICYIGGIILDADNMKQLLESDIVLILPVIDCTKRDNIYTFIDICTRNGISIIGSAPII